MSDETVCGRCRLPIHRDSPMQYFGTFVTHQPNECVRLLRAENERLRQDAKRYRWLRSGYRCDPDMSGDHLWWLADARHTRLRGPNTDAAIDAAMKATGSPADGG